MKMIKEQKKLLSQADCLCARISGAWMQEYPSNPKYNPEREERLLLIRRKVFLRSDRRNLI